MRSSSQLPERGPTDVDDAPAPAHLSKSLIMMMFPWQHEFCKECNSLNNFERGPPKDHSGEIWRRCYLKKIVG